MTLIEKIIEAILSDDASTAKQSEILIRIYENSSNQALIDDCFICLCGYGLKTLMSQ
ncbi:hypothetical protein [Legionella feeleii]|uniref:Uncharacterized protein n=1 Tax=Legionella feeleii TaxID=453 RepID=A0A0W0TH69_9GAMM|nr:hypothetical protein [Legionella feeleii]KTC94889.1 hypothetical protein Lfee_2553 [Legionella feeleii]SPX62027.1 Uncharacterised protein [Legionella feeleii]